MEVETKRKFVFVSNYLNHHQIPFCRAIYERMGGSFVFIQTEPMEEERRQMGWDGGQKEPYLVLFYEEKERCEALIREADVVLYGGTDEEKYLQERLRSGKFILRYSERLYRWGQWKFVSPRGLRKKYLDHVRYRKSPVYLLCNGAYVPSDFHLIHAYPGKMFCWGYFPEAKQHDLETLMAGKGWQTEDGRKIPYLLWAARMIDCKHPELMVETANYLKNKGIEFHLDVIGAGALEQMVRDKILAYGLEEQVSLLGFMKPEEVRSHMEAADVFLITSDKIEGWGAVANEAMNSGCAVVADHMIGSAPYLIVQGENGFVYRDGDVNMLFELTERLIKDEALRRSLGEKAYHTIYDTWNAGFASWRLCRLIEKLTGQRLDEDASDDALYEKAAEDGKARGFAPCDPAPVISERKMFRYLTEK